MTNSLSATFSETLRFSALSRSLAIHTDHPEVSSYLKNAYARVALTAPADLKKECDIGAICCAGAKHYVTFNDEPVNFAKQAALDTPFRAAFYGSSKLFRSSFRLDPDWLSLYGAALRINDRGVLIASYSGTGKTTLTLGLIARGAQFYSDEYVFIRKSDKMLSGLPRTLMIRERTLSVVGDSRLQTACSKLKSRQPSRGSRVWDFVDAGVVFGESVFSNPAALSLVVILERSAADVVKVEKLASSIAAAEILPHVNVAGSGFDRLTDVAAALGGVPCYRLVAGKQAATVDALLGLVASDAS